MGGVSELYGADCGNGFVVSGLNSNLKANLIGKTGRVKKLFTQ